MFVDRSCVLGRPQLEPPRQRYTLSFVPFSQGHHGRFFVSKINTLRGGQAIPLDY